MSEEHRGGLLFDDSSAEPPSAPSFTRLGEQHDRKVALLSKNRAKLLSMIMTKSFGAGTSPNLVLYQRRTAAIRCNCRFL